MGATGLGTVVRHIYNLAGSPEGGELSDAQLLQRFADKDRDALEILVRRHGPLVWRVCRRVLRQANRAGDAFQATFLVLANKARSIRKPAALGSWLYGVAHRIACRAKSDIDRHSAIGEP